MFFVFSHQNPKLLIWNLCMEKTEINEGSFCFSLGPNQHANLKNYAPGGTRTPNPGLIRPMPYQTELPEQHQPKLGIDPRTFKFTVWCSPNWATWAHTEKILETGSKMRPKGKWVTIYTAMLKCSAVTQSTPKILIGASRKVFVSPSHNMQNSVKLCYPYILNATCQSEWFAFGVQSMRK